MSAVLDLSEYRLRPMRKRDLAQITAIESRAYQYPWSSGIFQDCLRVGYSCWVYEDRRCIQAYAIMAIAAAECHVMNLTVNPAVHGQGVGRAVLRRLIAIASDHGADTMLLEARPSNHAALKLYRSEGFNELGTRRAYYPARGGREDAVILAKALSP